MRGKRAKQLRKIARKAYELAGGHAQAKKKDGLSLNFFRKSAKRRHHGLRVDLKTLRFLQAAEVS